MGGCFEEDLRRAEQYSYQQWRERPLREKLAEQVLRPLKGQF
jgi:hypothetical protein